MDWYAVMPATTKTTVCMNIQVTTRPEKPKA